MEVVLEIKEGTGWIPLGRGATDADGRLSGILRPDHALAAGTYRLTFATGAATGAAAPGFFPEVTIAFTVDDPGQHYHVPLLLSPFGYTTYRGS
jgi:5-hydroxyisourate hydrolase